MVIHTGKTVHQCFDNIYQGGLFDIYV